MLKDEKKNISKDAALDQTQDVNVSKADNNAEQGVELSDDHLDQVSGGITLCYDK